MTVSDALAQAEKLLPGTQSPYGEKDARWEAIIAVSEFIEAEPEAIWPFVERWGQHPDEDLRSAISTCVLEHMLEHHFDLIFPRVERLARTNSLFAVTTLSCWKFGQTTLPKNSVKFDRLLQELREQ